MLVVNSLAVLLLLSTLSCNSSSSCGEEKEHEEISPKRTYKAVLFSRNCGVTTGYVSHINILNGSKEVDREVHGKIEEGEIFVVSGLADIALTWQSESSLSIACNNCSRFKVITTVNNWKDIKISYSLK